MGWLRLLRSELAFAALLAGLILLSLRPVAAVERLFGALGAPFTLTAGWTRPLARFGHREVLAADERAQLGVIEEAESRAFLRDLYASALPTRDDLLENRRLIPAAVIARPPKNRDVLVLEPWSFEGLEVGLPVVHRDAYVGRVIELDPQRGTAMCALITDPDVFVGAELLPPSKVAALGRPEDRLQWVVGGIALDPLGAGRRDPRTWIAAHNPSRRGGFFKDGELFGPVVVHELLGELDPFGYLAEGFSLGEIERGAREDEWRVAPELDFLHGLFHVVVLAPLGADRLATLGADQVAAATASADASIGLDAALPPEPPHPLSQTNWTRARTASSGDPSAWRASLVVDRGAGAGVESGAACVRGARLIGRVIDAAPLSARVALIGDPGLELTAVARLVDHPELPPRVLGRLVSLGHAKGSGRPLLHWRDVVPLEVPGAAEGDVARVRLFTGSGQRGLPAGLLIGEARLRVSHSTDQRGQVFELLDSGDALTPKGDVWLRLPRLPSTAASGSREVVQ